MDTRASISQLRALLSGPSGFLPWRLYTNAGYLGLGTAAFAFLGLAFWNVVARLHTPEVVGLAGTAITSLFLLAQVSHLGLGYALIHAIPRSGSQSVPQIGRSLVAITAGSLLLGLVFLGTLPMWSQELKALLWQSPGYAGGYLAFAVFVSVLGVLRFVVIAYRRSEFVLALNLTEGTVRIPLAVALGSLGSAFGIVAGHGLGALAGVALMAFLFLSRRTGQWRLPLALDVWKLAPLMPFALSNLASHVLTVCSWMLLPLVVIALSGAQAAGFFYVAWAVTRLAMVMTQQLALSLFAEGSHNLQGFQHRARGAMLVGLALGGLFALVVYFVGDVVLLLFGREYVEQSSSVLKVLAAATPLAAITNNYLGVQRVRERIIPLLAVSAVVTACMLGGTAAFVPRFGIVGAGYGVVLGYGAGALLSLMLLYTSIKRSRKSMEPSEIRAA